MGLRELSRRGERSRVLLRKRPRCSCSPLRELPESLPAVKGRLGGAGVLGFCERDFFEECLERFFFFFLLLFILSTSFWRLSNFLLRSFTRCSNSDIFVLRTRVQAKKKAEVGLQLWDFVFFTRRVYKLQKLFK